MRQTKLVIVLRRATQMTTTVRPSSKSKVARRVMVATITETALIVTVSATYKSAS